MRKILLPKEIIMKKFGEMFPDDILYDPETNEMIGFAMTSEGTSNNIEMKFKMVMKELAKEFDEKKVVFNTDTYKHSSSMKALDFHLPFQSIKIVFSVPQRIYGEVYTKEVNIYDAGNCYSLISPEIPKEKAVGFKVCESGEIELIGADTTTENLFDFMNSTEKSAETNKINIGYLYTFVYEVISTIDFINHSEYVTTEHTVKHWDEIRGVVIKKIEKRIKIRREKHSTSTESTGKGTKHRYKYRVRGHFRKVEDKEIWIKDHVRGGDGTIFIPKEYEL